MADRLAVMAEDDTGTRTLSRSSLVSFDFPSWKFDPTVQVDAPTSGKDSSWDRAALLHDLSDLVGDDDESSASQGLSTADVSEYVTSAPVDVSDHDASAFEGFSESASSSASSAASDSDLALWLCGGASWPDDVLFAVLWHLASARDLMSTRAVSLAWREAGSCDALWEAQWQAHPRFPKRPPRRPCGARAFAPRPPRWAAFDAYKTRARAVSLYKWFDLQLGWDRLEALLAPERLGSDNGASSATAAPSDGATARKLSSILAARDWLLLHNCVLLLQLECSEQIANAVLEDAAAVDDVPPSQSPQSHPAVEAGSPTTAPPLVVSPAASATLPHHDASADERVLVRLIRGWRAYQRWLSHVCGTFAHHAGSSCGTHLVCLLAAQRSTERLDQHTCVGGDRTLAMLSARCVELTP